MGPRQLANLFPASRNGPTVDKAKVTKLRAAIEMGRYRTDPLAIAEALLRLERKG
jgi:flagellar biosynthesis anti-sigma factor FlgM